jgi:hypothetical protein
VTECNKVSKKETEELTERNHRQAKKKYLQNLSGKVMEYERTGHFV